MHHLMKVSSGSLYMGIQHLKNKGTKRRKGGDDGDRLQKKRRGGRWHVLSIQLGVLLLKTTPIDDGHYFSVEKEGRCTEA